MKKSIVVVSLVMVMSGAAYANNSNHQSGVNNNAEYSIGTVNGSVSCNQSGANNSCEIDIENAQNVVIQSGATVNIQGNTLDQEVVDKLQSQITTNTKNIAQIGGHIQNLYEENYSLTNQVALVKQDVNIVEGKADYATEVALNANQLAVNNANDIADNTNHIGDLYRADVEIKKSITNLGDEVEQVNTQQQVAIDTNTKRIEEVANRNDITNSAQQGMIDSNTAAINKVKVDSVNRGNVLAQSIADNADKIASVDSASQARDAQLADSIKTVNADSVQRDTELADNINSVHDQSVNRDAQLSQAITTETTERIKADNWLSTRINQNAYEISAEAAKRMQADKELQAQITGNAREINALWEVTGQQQVQLNQHADRLGLHDRQIAALQNDIERLDGAMAASAAHASLVNPRYAGTFTLGVGVGHYNGNNALAVGGIVNFDDKTAVKVTVSGSDQDWSKPLVSASFNVSFD